MAISIEILLKVPIVKVFDDIEIIFSKAVIAEGREYIESVSGINYRVINGRLIGYRPNGKKINYRAQIIIENGNEYIPRELHPAFKHIIREVDDNDEIKVGCKKYGNCPSDEEIQQSLIGLEKII